MIEQEVPVKAVGLTVAIIMLLVFGGVCGYVFGYTVGEESFQKKCITAIVSKKLVKVNGSAYTCVRLKKEK